MYNPLIREVRGLVNKNKKYISNILIGLGGVLLMVCIISLGSNKYYQYKLLHEEIPVLSDEVTEESKSDIEVAFNKEDYYKKKTNLNVQNEKSTFDRSGYKSGMMIISIPKINVKAAVIEGTKTEMLKKGPGLYEKSPLPDSQGGNVCIAGHRTTYGAWFRKVNELNPKDEVILEFNGKQYIYLVEKVFIVASNDWTVTNTQDYSALTLTACHPIGSSKQRIVVRGKLSEIKNIQ